MEMEHDKIRNVAIKQLQQFKLDYSQEFSEPEIIIAIKQYEEHIPLLTKGNFSLFIGKPKSRKTTFISILVSAYLNGENGLYNMKGEVNDAKVLWIDTEQTCYHLSKGMNSIFKQVPLSQERLETYRFRNMEPEDRFTNVKHLIEHYTSLGISLIVLDGVADLLTAGYNDEKEAIKISNYLLKASEEYNCHIITVLHENKGNTLAKGHIGSYLNQKAESVIRITKDTNNSEKSTIKSQFTRNRDFISFDLLYQDGLPVIASNSNFTLKNVELDTIVTEKQKEFVNEIFQHSKNGFLLRNEILKFMTEPNSIFTNAVSMNAAKLWLKKLLDLDLIYQDTSKRNAPYFIKIVSENEVVSH
jgi:hypothetical protein